MDARRWRGQHGRASHVIGGTCRGGLGEVFLRRQGRDVQSPELLEVPHGAMDVQRAVLGAGELRQRSARAGFLGRKCGGIGAGKGVEVG